MSGLSVTLPRAVRQGLLFTSLQVEEEHIPTHSDSWIFATPYRLCGSMVVFAIACGKDQVLGVWKLRDECLPAWL